MNVDPKENTGETENNEEQAQQKPYSKPEVIFFQPLEAMADVCQPPIGKTSPTDQCSLLQS